VRSADMNSSPRGALLIGAQALHAIRPARRPVSE
jgi:hypothetical protein